MSLVDNLMLINQNIKDTLIRNNHRFCTQEDGVRLLAVTKTLEVSAIKEALSLGVSAIAENRVQEAAGKRSQITELVEWHLIGHLQTNKVRQAVAMFDIIHSVDSERLAVAISRAAVSQKKRQPVLIQVNVAQEDTKFGATLEQAVVLARFVSSLEGVALCGLMTVAPYYEHNEKVRPIFKELYRLFTALKQENGLCGTMKWLSMGMSNDYVLAIEEGANLVRIGTGLFGSRQSA